MRFCRRWLPVRRAREGAEAREHIQQMLLHHDPAIAMSLSAHNCLQALVAVRRAREGGEARERSHLLALYPELTACVGGREPRVQAALRELLTAAGVQLGLNGEGV